VIASDIPPNRSILGAQQVFSSSAEAISAIRRVLVDDSYRQALLDEQRARRGRYGSIAMRRGWESVYNAVTGDTRPPNTEVDNVADFRQPFTIHQLEPARCQGARN